VFDSANPPIKSVQTTTKQHIDAMETPSNAAPAENPFDKEGFTAEQTISGVYVCVCVCVRERVCVSVCVCVRVYVCV
jgi:hypothetical protein